MFGLTWQWHKGAMQSGTIPHFDFIVVGVGMVGAAIALGLAREGQSVLALDGSDGDFRAARGNGGLVWVQSKGVKMPPYRVLTERSAGSWPEFSRLLRDVTGIDVDLDQRGGLALCLGEKEFEARRKRLSAWSDPAQRPKYEMVGRDEVERLFKGIALGPEVSGASYGTKDGSVNPLKLLLALQTALIRSGGRLETGNAVRQIEAGTIGGFLVTADNGRYGCDRLVLAAGNGTPELGRMVGLDVPITPERGQAMVTERVQPFLPLPTIGVRQSPEGSVFLGTTKEEVGFDIGVTADAAGHMASRAVRTFPQLARIKVLRQWGCLRIMSPDGHPVYAESETHPGAYVAVCHSGLTLASSHTTDFPQMLISGSFAEKLAPFHHRRFDVSQSH